MDCLSPNDLEQPCRFWSGGHRFIGFRLCGLTPLVQASVLDGRVFDGPPFSRDGFIRPQENVDGGEFADALVLAMEVVGGDESGVGGC